MLIGKNGNLQIQMENKSDRKVRLKYLADIRFRPKVEDPTEDSLEDQLR